MAATLSISPSTVRKHVQNIFDKLNVHSRLGAVLAAFEKQIL
jgi:DNA-binding NarL/FixJ family response regulator